MSFLGILVIMNTFCTKEDAFYFKHFFFENLLRVI